MENAKYSYEIRKVFKNVDFENQENLENLIENVVVYCVSNNNSKTNWLAHELLNEVIENEKIIEIFDEN